MPQSPEKAYEDMDYVERAEYHAKAAMEQYDPLQRAELRAMNVGLSQTFALLAIGEQVNYLTGAHASRSR